MLLHVWLVAAAAGACRKDARPIAGRPLDAPF